MFNGEIWCPNIIYKLANVNIKKLSLLLSDFRFAQAWFSLFKCLSALQTYTIIPAKYTCISSSIQLFQMFIFITNIKKYYVKTSNTIDCRNVLFSNNLKKNKHTLLWKTPQKVAPIYPVIEPINTTFYIVLQGNIWLRKALEPER